MLLAAESSTYKVLGVILDITDLGATCRVTGLVTGYAVNVNASRSVLVTWDSTKSVITHHMLKQNASL